MGDKYEAPRGKEMCMNPRLTRELLAQARRDLVTVRERAALAADPFPEPVPQFATMAEFESWWPRRAAHEERVWATCSPPTKEEVVAEAERLLAAEDKRREMAANENAYHAAMDWWRKKVGVYRDLPAPDRADYGLEEPTYG